VIYIERGEAPHFDDEGLRPPRSINIMFDIFFYFYKQRYFCKKNKTSTLYYPLKGITRATEIKVAPLGFAVPDVGPITVIVVPTSFIDALT